MSWRDWKPTSVQSFAIVFTIFCLWGIMELFSALFRDQPVIQGLHP